MDSSSNQLGFCTLTQTYDNVDIASGTTINTDSLITTGASHASVITDIVFRNLDGSNARSFDIIICATGSNATAKYNVAQIAIPANSGNNGTTALASLAALAPQLFDIDLAGNRVITLESGISIYVRNKAALTADMIVMAKRRNF
ncbi:MAG TPA: hypothetical protein VGN20_20590 [Mucilaginibacter sp.]|jgi:hypothetical protein